MSAASSPPAPPRPPAPATLRGGERQRLLGGAPGAVDVAEPAARHGQGVQGGGRCALAPSPRPALRSAVEPARRPSASASWPSVRRSARVERGGPLQPGQRAGQVVRGAQEPPRLAPGLGVLRPARVSSPYTRSASAGRRPMRADQASTSSRSFSGAPAACSSARSMAKRCSSRSPPSDALQAARRYQAAAKVGARATALRSSAPQSCPSTGRAAHCSPSWYQR